MKKGCDLPYFNNINYDTCQEACAELGNYANLQDITIHSLNTIIIFCAKQSLFNNVICILLGKPQNPQIVDIEVNDIDYQGEDPHPYITAPEHGKILVFVSYQS